jgi:hypothetical protein
MKYKAVSSSERLYPDIFEYPTAKQSLSSHAARGGYLSAQIQLTDLSIADGENALSCKMTGAAADFEIELYEMVAVFVGESTLQTYNPKPLYPIRPGPFYIYDCMKPLGENIAAMKGTAGLYICAYVPKDCKAGIYNGALEIETGGEKIKIPVEFTVHKAVVPEESLKFIHFYNSQATAKYHNVESGSAEHAELDVQYHKMMRRMHQNMLIARGIDVKKTGENEYSFDFAKFEEYVGNCISLGFKYFLLYIGGRHSWKESTIYVHGDIPCLTYEGYSYLLQYLSALNAVLKKNGWFDMFYLGISDEPNEANAVEYRALCGMVRHLIPGIRLLDAMSYGPFFGSLDVYIPLNSEYEKHKDVFERFRSGGDELWHYVCCGPRGEGYINRFMDYPLLSTRYLFWGNYKHNLTGYLHWAVNQYQPGQNPFTDNWPDHRNADSQCILPPGDTHIIYPGENAPWMSIRLETQRESAEEYEMLKALAVKDKAAADRICGKCFRAFNDVENDAVIFGSVRTELLEALGNVQ